MIAATRTRLPQLRERREVVENYRRIAVEMRKKGAEIRAKRPDLQSTHG